MMEPCYVCGRQPHLHVNVSDCEWYSVYKYICVCGNRVLMGSPTSDAAVEAWNDRQARGANVPRNEPVVPLFDDGKWGR